jgi:hypothetical protein
MSVRLQHPTAFLHFCSHFMRSETGCWEWTGFLNNQGYGAYDTQQHRTKPRILLAHRFSWQVFFGEISKGKCVCHKCDNKKCVNPDHLFVGTQSENLLDMYRKGRRISHRLPGEKNPNAKLTAENVTEIKLARSQRVPVKDVAKKFGVSCSTIFDITKGRSWKGQLH